MRTSDAIKTDVIKRFGFFPAFYTPAFATPAILENLWQQTLTASIENPIPTLFKEKLFALLARHCPVPYEVVCHACALRSLGVKAKEILALLEQPTPDSDAIGQAMTKALDSISKPAEKWPAVGSAHEQALFLLAIGIFQNQHHSQVHQAALKKLLSPHLGDYLILFLAFVKTCLAWTEAHPTLSFEDDQRAKENFAPLLSEEPRLGHFFRDYYSRFQSDETWRQEEKSLRKTEKLFKLLVEGVMDYAIIMIDLNGIITEWNVGAERILGYQGDEVVGKPLEIFFTPEDRAAGQPQKELATARAVGHARDERFHLHKSGARLWVKGFMEAIKSEDGTLQAYAKIVQDLTERQKIENELARWTEELEERVKRRTQELAHSQDALHQAQKLEAVGQLAGGVAHDFNNLITGILGVSEELQSTLDDGDPRKEDVEEIIKASRRAFGVTRQLLAFGRRQIIQPRVLEIKIIIGEIHKWLARVLGEDIEIRLNLREKSRIKMDQGQLEQILMNLAINARDAMPQGGTLTIHTADVQLHDGDSSRYFQVPAGPYVMLEVSDTGQGMDKEVLSHIFEPFFTTKGKDRGTGLGLATVYGIIKQSSGDIHVYSEPGIGTSMKIYFPASVGDQAFIENKVVAAHSAQGQEVVLVVEDEDIVRRVVVKRLARQGYTILEARNGKEALELVRAKPAPIDLIITDVVMPGMTGREVIDKIREMRPNVPALYMSGYPEDIIAHRGILEPGIDFIEKSHMATDLAAKVRDVIEKARLAIPTYEKTIHNPSAEKN